MRIELSLNEMRLEALNHHLEIREAIIRRGMLVPDIGDELMAYTIGAARAAGWKPAAEMKRRGKA